MFGDGATGLVEFPEADDREGTESHDARTRGQTVQPVCDVHAIRRANHQGGNPNDQQNQPDNRAKSHEVDVQIAEERNLG